MAGRKSPTEFIELGRNLKVAVKDEPRPKFGGDRLATKSEASLDPLLVAIIEAMADDMALADHLEAEGKP